jgi:hypothetical protein
VLRGLFLGLRMDYLTLFYFLVCVTMISSIRVYLMVYFDFEIVILLKVYLSNLLILYIHPPFPIPQTDHISGSCHCPVEYKVGIMTQEHLLSVSYH